MVLNVPVPADKDARVLAAYKAEMMGRPGLVDAADPTPAEIKAYIVQQLQSRLRAKVHAHEVQKEVARVGQTQVSDNWSGP